MFFSEEKNQKTVIPPPVATSPAKSRIYTLAPTQKSLGSFLQKTTFLNLILALCTIGTAQAQSQTCPPRPPPSAILKNPFDLQAANGVLKAAITMRSQVMSEFPLKLCYAYTPPGGTVEAPTLRLAPGDVLDLTLSDRLTYLPHATHLPTSSPPPHDPCAGGAVAATSTNLVFDGLSLAPACHQGEATETTLENTDPPFNYRFRLPDDTPPGMSLYHPHLMGSADLQVSSGASGVLIVGGMEKAKPEMAGLAERILVFREQLDDPDSIDDASWISINFQPVGYRHLKPPLIRMKPGAREFWRVANATPGAFLNLRLLYGTGEQTLTLVALDGVPTVTDEDVTTLALPPGGRAEFIVTGPAIGQSARLVHTGFETGPTGTETPAQDLARIVAAADAAPPPPVVPATATPAWTAHTTLALAERSVTTLRHLYVAAAASGTNGPTRYLLTVDGQHPTLFDPSAPPAITTHVGAVEDWIIANHTGEAHAFHLQGTHVLLLEVDGQTLAHPDMRDTVTIPPWTGMGSFPTVKLRVDFASPASAGAHIAECHILKHAEAGLMAKIRVDQK